MSEEFVVNDKRLFSKDGQVNESAPSEPARPAEAPGWDAPREEQKSEPRPGGPLPPANLPSLMVGLATSAFIHLGEEGVDGEAKAPDLEAAKHAIDLLAVLQTKTRGNLEREEDELLVALLYDLRMKYVEACQKKK